MEAMFKKSAVLAGLLLLVAGSGCGKKDSGPSARPSPTPFLTTTVSGLRLWLKGDGITPLADGSALATWPDSSGLGNDAVGVGGTQPTYKTGIANNWPVVRFSGAQYLSSPVVAATGNAGRTVIAVVTNTTVTNVAVEYNHVLHFGAYSPVAGTEDISYGLVVGCNSGQAGGQNMGNHYNLDGHSSTFPAIAGTMLIENSYDLGIDTFYYNGNSGGFKAVTLNTSSSGVVIGARVDHAQEFLTGDIAEILIYSPAISASDRGVVENYLAYKYQIY
jgi:hypothetical protein